MHQIKCHKGVQQTVALGEIPSKSQLAPRKIIVALIRNFDVGMATTKVAKSRKKMFW